MPAWFPRGRAFLVGLVLLLAAASRASAQVIVKVNETVNFRLGVLGQFQADWLEDPAEDDTSQNLFVRRARVLFGGQVADRVTFFIETDAPNLGKTLPDGKNISPGVILQDAYGEFRIAEALALNAGLMFVPFSRNSIQSGATLLPIDYGPFTFFQNAATQSVIGRDAGFQARGHLLENRFEYRIGAFQGLRDERSHRSFRYAGRVQYQLLETEGTGFFYTGTYLGTKRVLAVGAAFDTQDEYDAFDVDAFVDQPMGDGAVTAQLAYNRIDGGGTFLTLPEQHQVLLELGYFFPGPKLTPVFQFAQRNVDDTEAGDERRWSLGVNYWWAAHNANIKAAYGRIDPSGQPEQHQFTVQLQLFYY